MDDMQPEESMVERLLERLETGLESAVSQERFKEASALRDEISRMHMDDTSSVLKVTTRARAFRWAWICWRRARIVWESAK